MSANQIPGPIAPPSSDQWDNRPRPHACTRCRYMGGVGHALPELLKLTRHEYDGNPTASIGIARKTCNYWSARKQEHCGGTGRVQTHGSIGPRCVGHTP